MAGMTRSTDSPGSVVGGVAAATPPPEGATALARPAIPPAIDTPVLDTPAVDAPAEVTRRAFHTYVAASLSSFAGLVLGLPILGYLAAPLATTVKAAWLSLGRVDSFKPGEPKLVALSVTRKDGWRDVTEARTAWVVAQGNNQFVAYNGRCTHLGCAYSWRAEGDRAQKFVCPCHDGVYDVNGTVLSGPPPRPLDRLEVKVDSGEVLALYQDFRLGVPTHEAV